jgi:hypothetical protein
MSAKVHRANKRPCMSQSTCKMDGDHMGSILLVSAQGCGFWSEPRKWCILLVRKECGACVKNTAHSKIGLLRRNDLHSSSLAKGCYILHL